MENTIRAGRAHFFLLSCVKIRILDCLGRILEATWVALAKFLDRLLKTPILGPKTAPRCAQNPQEKKTISRRNRETDPRRGTPSGLLGKADGVPLLGSVFGTFWAQFGCQVAPMLGHLAPFGYPISISSVVADSPFCGALDICIYIYIY